MYRYIIYTKSIYIIYTDSNSICSRQNLNLKILTHLPIILYHKAVTKLTGYICTKNVGNSEPPTFQGVGPCYVTIKKTVPET